MWNRPSSSRFRGRQSSRSVCVGCGVSIATSFKPLAVAGPDPLGSPIRRRIPAPFRRRSPVIVSCFALSRSLLQSARSSCCYRFPAQRRRSRRAARAPHPPRVRPRSGRTKGRAPGRRNRPPRTSRRTICARASISLLTIPCRAGASARLAMQKAPTTSRANSSDWVSSLPVTAGRIFNCCRSGKWAMTVRHRN
jgi:hypothetical protein